MVLQSLLWAGWLEGSHNSYLLCCWWKAFALLQESMEQLAPNLVSSVCRGVPGQVTQPPKC